MKIASCIILIASLALMIYGYWGAFTTAGNKVYDEMDGYYPFFMLLGGVVLFIVFFVLLFISNRRGRTNRSD
ncbi:MAG: hypothetical protein ABIN74_11060 [Ferruginibacter sp.]